MFTLLVILATIVVNYTYILKYVHVGELQIQATPEAPQAVSRIKTTVILLPAIIKD